MSKFQSRKVHVRYHRPPHILLYLELFLRILTPHHLVPHSRLRPREQRVEALVLLLLLVKSHSLQRLRTTLVAANPPLIVALLDLRVLPLDDLRRVVLLRVIPTNPEVPSFVLDFLIRAESPVLPHPVILFPLIEYELPFPVPKVVPELTFVVVPVPPFIHPKSILLVIFIFSFIFFILRNTFPQPVTMSIPFLEVPFILIPILPFVNSITIRFTSLVLSFVGIAISKFFRALAVFQKVLEFAFISISIDPNVHSKAINLVFFPFSDILIAFGPFPYSTSMPQPLDPLSVIDFSVCALKSPFSLSFSFVEVAIVFSATGIEHQSAAIFFIVFEVSLKYSSILKEYDSLGMIQILLGYQFRVFYLLQSAHNSPQCYTIDGQLLF